MIDWCVAFLTGEISGEEAYGAELPKLVAITGSANPGGWSAPVDPVNYYWIRVWAARVFLYVWRDDVVDALLVAASDPAWRVREHVARHHRATGAGPARRRACCRISTTSCRGSARPAPARSVPRVRPSTPKRCRSSSTTRTLTVRVAAEKALARLEKRLDRSLRLIFMSPSGHLDVRIRTLVTGTVERMETSRRSVLKAGLASTAAVDRPGPDPDHHHHRSRHAGAAGPVHPRHRQRRPVARRVRAVDPPRRRPGRRRRPRRHAEPRVRRAVAGRDR